MKLASEEFDRISRALADPQRREILQKLVMTSQLNCSDIHALFDISQPTVSHHLKELLFAGLVQKDKQGQYCFYHVKSEVLSAYVRELQRRLGLSTLQVAPRVR
jgi:ArsR family transcriptional regulator, arsenate/arsenite/antimonite-responsive transcriptional repressor